MSQRDQAYEQMKSMILGGDLKPGEPLREQHLATQTGTSRTPVREALHELAREGLARLVPGRGAFVTEIAIPDLYELFQLRDALEPYAVQLAAWADDRERVIPLLEELEERGTSLIEEDVSSYYDLIARLDACTLELAGNSRLSDYLTQVWTQIRRARRLAGTNRERLLETVDEHTEIFRAILEGDGDRAAELSREHVNRSLQHLSQLELLRPRLRLSENSGAPSPLSPRHR
ncbi:MAG: FCD domain-containing protein [Acidimicrobiia bacterium]|nr:FCD domain-containing protein [Acidimicrobiia bacterium]